MNSAEIPAQMEMNTVSGLTESFISARTSPRCWGLTGAACGGGSYKAEVCELFSVRVVSEHCGVAELSLDTLEDCAAHVADADKT